MTRRSSRDVITVTVQLGLLAAKWPLALSFGAKENLPR